MRGKIVNATSEHGKKFVGTEGILKIDYLGSGKLFIEKDGGGFIRTTRIKKITVETKNTVYEIEIQSEV